ncbi:MAG: ADOP family duplicated permease [Gemmatimonadota bacterium]
MPEPTPALYRALLHLLPRPFRLRFGAEMGELFVMQMAMAPNRVARVRLWISAIADLMVQGTAERFQLRPRAPSLTPTPPSDSMGTLRYTLRSAFRTLLARPGFTLPVVLTLGLGIGLASAMALVVNGVLLKPLSYPEPEQLVRLSERTANAPSIETSVLTFTDWRERATGISAMAAAVHRNIAVTGISEPTRVPALFVTADFFRVAGVQLFKGRAYGADENREGALPVVVVSHGFWRETLGSPASLDQARITVADLLNRSEQYQVVGVMPPEFDLLGSAQLYLPLERGVPWNVRNHTVAVIARLRPGVPLATASASLNAVQASIRAEDPRIDALGVTVQPLADEILGPVRQPLLLLLGSAALLLLIAFTNVAGVLLARGIARQPEMRLRTALGAGRGRLIGQLIAESAVLAGMAAIAASIVAKGLFTLFAKVDPTVMPRLQQVAPGWPGLLLVSALLAMAGVGLFGVSSALLTTQWGAAGLRVRGSTAQPGQRAVWRALLAAEVALAFTLLIVAGLLGRSLWRIASVETGFDATDVATVEATLPADKYHDNASLAGYFERALATLRAVPGVQEAGVNIILPLPGASSVAGPVHLEGRDTKDLIAQYRIADEGYFKALRIPLLRGRLFDDRDRENTEHAAVINSAMAKQFWGNADAIGKRFSIPGMDGFGDAWLTVVGVVADARPWNVAEGAQVMYYVNYRQRPTFLGVMGGNLVIRGSKGMVAPQAIRQALAAVDPNVPLRISTLPERLGRGTADRQFILTILGVFASLALVLSAVGIWSVSSFVISRRVREMGIRLAVGATPSQVRRLLQREAMIPLGVGLAGGVALAEVATRWIQSLLFGVSAADAFTFGAAAATLACTTWIASFLPARRTARFDPSKTLRGE